MCVVVAVKVTRWSKCLRYQNNLKYINNNKSLSHSYTFNIKYCFLNFYNLIFFLCSCFGFLNVTALLGRQGQTLEGVIISKFLVQPSAALIDKRKRV